MAILCSAVIVGACGNDRLDTIPPTGFIDTGSVQGRICATEDGIGSGQGFYLADATVTVTVGTTTWTTTTDMDGNFRIESLPVGTHMLVVTKGSFSSSLMITITENDTADLSFICFDSGANLGVVTGIFDSVEDVLQGLGFTVTACIPSNGSFCPGSLDPTGNITLIDGLFGTFVSDVLCDPFVLGTFDILFLNCGLQDVYLRQDPQLCDLPTELGNYVANGGSIYASDWAYEALRIGFDGTFDFVGDGTANAAREGHQNLNLTAVVTDTGLLQALGTPTVQLVYDKSGWVVLERVQPASVVSWVRGDVTAFAVTQTIVDSPLLVSAPVGNGRIFFTTFHTHQQVNSQMTDILRHIVFEL